MPRLDFSLGRTGGTVLSLVEDQGPLTPDELALVTLDALALDPSVLHSRDGVFDGPGREGALMLSIGGQASSISWADDGKRLKNPAKFHDQLVYFGDHRLGLDMACRLIESDREVVSCLKEIGDGLSQLSSVSGQVPLQGAGAAAALQLANTILSFIAEQVDDDVELGYLGSLRPTDGSIEDPTRLHAGKYQLRRRSLSGPEIDPIGLDLVVHRFRPFSDGRVVLVLDSATFSLESRARMGTLFIEITAGTGRSARTFTFREPVRNGGINVSQVFSLNAKRLYAGSARFGIPLTVSAALVNDSNELDAIQGVISDTSALLASLGAADDLPLSDVTKAIQTARALLVEFLPRKTSIGTWSGLVAVGRWPDSMGPRPGCVRTADVAVGDQRPADVEPIEMSSDAGGQGTFRLSVMPVG